MRIQTSISDWLGPRLWLSLAKAYFLPPKKYAYKSIYIPPDLKFYY